MSSTPHTDEETGQIAERLERRLADLDTGTIQVDDTSDLRAIADSVAALHAAEEMVRERVETARAHGRSWNRIAIPLERLTSTMTSRT